MFKTPALIFNEACFLGVLEAHMSITADFFRNRLDQMIDLRHPLSARVRQLIPVFATFAPSPST